MVYAVFFLVFLYQIWERAGENGLLGVATPEEFGGIGADFLMSAIVMEEQ